MHRKDSTAEGRGRSAFVHGRQIVYSTSSSVESRNRSSSLAGAMLDDVSGGKETVLANQVVEGHAQVVSGRGRTKARERMTQEVGTIYTLYPDANATNSCTVKLAASCHNTRMYDDNRWDTLLEVKRLFDSSSLTEGWSRQPITTISFPVKTSILVTVVCERTAGFRLKCPLLRTSTGNYMKEGSCQRRTRQVVLGDQIDCMSNFERQPSIGVGPDLARQTS